MEKKYLLIGILILVGLIVGCSYLYTSQDQIPKGMLHTDMNEEIPKNLEATDESIASLLTYIGNDEIFMGKIEQGLLKNVVEVTFLQPESLKCTSTNQNPTLIAYPDIKNECPDEDPSPTGCASSRWALICMSKYFVFESLGGAHPISYGPFNILTNEELRKCLGPINRPVETGLKNIDECYHDCCLKQSEERTNCFDFCYSID